MAVHVLSAVQTVPASLDECWAFFSDARNLTRITPPTLDLQLVRALPPEIYPGLMIEYRVRPLFGLRTTWVTEITHARRPHYFADEQRIGPYRLWHHEHHFHTRPDGTTEVRDEVHYALPFHPWSALVHPWLVRPKLDEIFAFRRQAILEAFGAPVPPVAEQ